MAQSWAQLALQTSSALSDSSRARAIRTRSQCQRSPADARQMRMDEPSVERSSRDAFLGNARKGAHGHRG